jgi:TonB family protein
MPSCSANWESRASILASATFRKKGDAMRSSGCTLALSILLATSSWAQQDKVASNLPKTDALVISRADHSTPSDKAVPLCPVKLEDSLETNGVASVGDKSITPPKPTHMVNAEFSDEARHIGRKPPIRFFEVEVGLVADAKGNPQNICLIKSAGYGLDAKAAEAVRQYRFKSAIKDGKPVAVRIHVTVSYRLR